jgi:lipopolysaccharide export system permease protein
MIRIKRLYTFVLGTFFPLLLATFSVCLFILLMQFLWQYVNDMVGKGVGIGIMAELFFYASLSFTPMALPLSILLASLMTFGNLGEHLELLAMKASGISLLRIMKPLIYVVIVLVGISFYFQNDIVPRAKTKMYTIVLSLKQKSPELDIPEGIFYKEIPGYNVYVRHKDKKSGLLRDMMIYDYSGGFENAIVIVADSGILNSSADKKHLVLTLLSGESFRNFGTRSSRDLNKGIPYIRETFSLRKILISFDTNFSMADESIMGSRDLGKNMHDLTAFIDSVRQEQDSVNRQTSPYFKKTVYVNTFKEIRSKYDVVPPGAAKQDSMFAKGFEAYYDHLPVDRKIFYLQQAKSRSEQVQNDYNFSQLRQSDAQKQLLSHIDQFYQRYSMALACLLFFFIGAPLGAIIRKGGLGLPAVLSVIIYLLYYTVGTFGSKMVKQNVWPVWEGVWLSTALLLGLGIFFTYKAVNDSTMINPEAWKNAFQKFFGKKEVRNYQRKEVIMTPPDYPADVAALKVWNEQATLYLNEHKTFVSYFSFWKERGSDTTLNALIDSLEIRIEDLLNSDENLIIGKLMDYPVIRTSQGEFLNKRTMRLICELVFPAGLTLYFIARWKQKQVNVDLTVSRKVSENLIEEIEQLGI